MTYQEKAAALAALGILAILFREARYRIGRGDPWYIQQSVEIADGHTLQSGGGNGDTPEAAINDHWRLLVDELPPDKWLVLNAMRQTRRAVRWNGFMWADYHEPTR